MDIRHQYNEALNKLEEHVNDGLRDLINIYCVAIESTMSFSNESIATQYMFIKSLNPSLTCIVWLLIRLKMTLLILSLYT